MTKEEILKLFREEAETLGNIPDTQTDIIMRLAQLLAESRGKLSKENFEELIHIGAVLYQKGEGQFQARKDIASIMKQSRDDTEKK